MIDLRDAINIDLADDGFCSMHINGLWRFSIDRRYLGVVRSREHNFRKSQTGDIFLSPQITRWSADSTSFSSLRAGHATIAVPSNSWGVKIRFIDKRIYKQSAVCRITYFDPEKKRQLFKAFEQFSIAKKTFYLDVKNKRYRLHDIVLLILVCTLQRERERERERERKDIMHYITIYTIYIKRI